jgi:hypothetical protein
MKYIITERQLNLINENPIQGILSKIIKSKPVTSNVVKAVSSNVVKVPLKSLMRPNGVIGTQGFTSESLLDLINHISKVQNIKLPKYNSLKELISLLSKNPKDKEKIIQYVSKDPIVLLKLPDNTFKIKDGNHRANLLNLLGVEQVPSIIK